LVGTRSSTKRLHDVDDETFVWLYVDGDDDDCTPTSKKARPNPDEPSSRVLYELEKLHSTAVVLPRRDGCTPRPISSSEMRRFRVRTLIEECGGIDKTTCVDSAECFVCVESTLQRVVDRHTDGTHQRCAVARGDLCAECAARHFAQSSRCPACRRRWGIDDIQVVNVTTPTNEITA